MELVQRLELALQVVPLVAHVPQGTAAVVVCKTDLDKIKKYLYIRNIKRA